MGRSRLVKYSPPPLGTEPLLSGWLYQGCKASAREEGRASSRQVPLSPATCCGSELRTGLLSLASLFPITPIPKPS